MEHELHELHEYFATLFIHIRHIRAIRVQHISRGIFGWNTNFTNYTNTLQPYLSTFGIFVLFVFNIYHTKYLDGTRIALITRILCNVIYPHSAYSGNPCSIYFTHINSIEYELHGCVLKGRAQCHSQCLTHYYYLCPPHPHCIIKTFRYLSISFFIKIIIQFITYTLQNNH